MKSLTLHTHGCPRASLRDWSSSSSDFSVRPGLGWECLWVVTLKWCYINSLDREIIKLVGCFARCFLCFRFSSLVGTLAKKMTKKRDRAKLEAGASTEEKAPRKRPRKFLKPRDDWYSLSVVCRLSVFCVISLFYLRISVFFWSLLCVRFDGSLWVEMADWLVPFHILHCPTLSPRLDLPGIWPDTETKWEVWLLRIWFDIAPVNKMVSLTWLLWVLRTFQSFTVHYITYAINHIFLPPLLQFIYFVDPSPCIHINKCLCPQPLQKLINWSHIWDLL